MKKKQIFIYVILAIGVIAFATYIGFAAYQTYIIRSRIATIKPIIQDLINQSLGFADATGIFPTAYDLDLSDTPGDYYVTDPTQLSPYFGGVAITDDERSKLNISDISDPVECGAIGVIGSSLDVELMGFPKWFADNSEDNGFKCYFWNYEDKIYTQCFYGFGTAEASRTGNFIPDWINVNTTKDWDFNNLLTYDKNGFNDPECQW